jgi:hypothetical protein
MVYECLTGEETAGHVALYYPAQKKLQLVQADHQDREVD